MLLTQEQAIQLVKLNSLHKMEDGKKLASHISQLALDACSSTDKQRAELFPILFEHGYIIEDIAILKDKGWSNIFDGMKYSELMYNKNKIELEIDRLRVAEKPASITIHGADKKDVEATEQFMREASEAYDLNAKQQMMMMMDKIEQGMIVRTDALAQQINVLFKKIDEVNNIIKKERDYFERGMIENGKVLSRVNGRVEDLERAFTIERGDKVEANKQQ